MTLNIQLIFVFDGRGVPEKIRWKGKRGVPERLELLELVLECLGIPYYPAPAEAEAECAELQKLGIVDAVWSGDADALMFGCDLLISDHRIAKEYGDQNHSKGHTEKSKTHVRIIRAQKMKEELALDREGLILFAILAGGDYHPGLSNCGTKLALHAVQEGTLARELCECRNQLDCNRWRTKLTAFLRNRPCAKGILEPPPDFPQYDILRQYCKPTVTPGHELSKTRFDSDFSQPIQERELLKVTSSRFNIWGKLYMDHVGPVLLTRALVQKDNASSKNVLQGIKLKKQRKSNKAEVMDLRSVERAISFCPFEVTSLQRIDFEDGNLKGMWANKGDNISFDPTYVVKCDHFPAILLQHLESRTMSTPLPAAAKQKLAQHGEQSDGNSPTNNPMKRFKSSARSEVAPVTNIAHPTTPDLRKPQTHVLNTPPATRRPRAWPMTDSAVVLTESNDGVDSVLRLPPGRVLTASSTQSSSTISESGLPRSLTNEKNHPVNAICPSVKSPHLSPANSYVKKVLQDSSSPYGPYHTPKAASHHTPLRFSGEASSTQPAARHSELEQTRVARLQQFTPGHVVSYNGATSITRTRDESIKAPTGVIDLTGD